MGWWVKGSSWTSWRSRGSRVRNMNASPTTACLHLTDTRSKSQSTVSTPPCAAHSSGCGNNSAELHVHNCLLIIYVNPVHALLCIHFNLALCGYFLTFCSTLITTELTFQWSRIHTLITEQPLTALSAFFLPTFCFDFPSARSSRHHRYEEHGSPFGKVSHPALWGNGSPTSFLWVVQRWPQVRIPSLLICLMMSTLSQLNTQCMFSFHLCFWNWLEFPCETISKIYIAKVCSFLQSRSQRATALYAL